MLLSVKIICLLSVAVAVTYSSPVKEKHFQKSKLILEFDWPEPVKNLKRLPHPRSCSHFYHTKHDGSHVIKRCDEGELFDYLTLRCKEKAFAKCWKDVIKRITSKEKRKHFSCPFPWGVYPDTEDCSQFYECLGGIAYIRKCRARTLFDKADLNCVNENEAMCSDESDNIIHDGYKCPYKWGFFTHPKDCSKYYECLRKIPTIRTCKKGFLFDNFERKCLPMSSVLCSARFNPYEHKEKLTTNDRDIGVTVSIPNATENRVSSNPEVEVDVTKNPRTEVESISLEDRKINREGVSKKLSELPEEVTSDISKESGGVATEISKKFEDTAEFSSKPKEISAELSKKPEVVTTGFSKKPEEVFAGISEKSKGITTEFSEKPERIIHEDSNKSNGVKMEISKNLQEATTGFSKKLEEVTSEFPQKTEAVVLENSKKSGEVKAEISEEPEGVTHTMGFSDNPEKIVSENFKNVVMKEISKNPAEVISRYPKKEGTNVEFSKNGEEITTELTKNKPKEITVELPKNKT